MNESSISYHWSLITVVLAFTPGNADGLATTAVDPRELERDFISAPLSSGNERRIAEALSCIQTGFLVLGRDVSRVAHAVVPRVSVDAATVGTDSVPSWSCTLILCSRYVNSNDR